MTDRYSAVATLPQRANLKRDALQPLALVGGRLPRPILIEPGRPELLRTLRGRFPYATHGARLVNPSNQPRERRSDFRGEEDIAHGTTGPSRRLGRLAERIAEVRGTPVECLGSTDLAERDAHGEPQLIMQADELVYLHPARAKLPWPVLTVGEHDLPEMVLEVDHTTDARCRKLRQYQAWGFPEVWIRGAGGSLGEPPAQPAHRA